jgi:hypothetical protein
LLTQIFTGAVIGAFTIGIIGFAIGFFGPMVFMPEANQGPLIGIFFTGPLGALAGAAIGAFVGWHRGSRTRSR